MIEYLPYALSNQYFNIDSPVIPVYPSLSPGPVRAGSGCAGGMGNRFPGCVADGPSGVEFWFRTRRK